MIECKICSYKFKNINSLSKHITAKHKDVTKEKYYFDFIDKSSGFCYLCNNKTSFRGLSKGFSKYCSNICSNKCKIKRNKISKTCKGKKQSKETIDKRINNTNQERKEKSRKEAMIKNYGVSNWSQTQTGKKNLSKVHKGSRKPRSTEHQKKIINSKIKNKTTKHTKKTKIKISKSIKSSKKFQECISQGKNISKSNGKNMSGYFNNVYFRSSYELSFLIQMFEDKIKVMSAESKEFVVDYEHENTTKKYFPDFYIPSKNLIVEIKPASMCILPANVAKFKAASKKYKSSFKVISESDLHCLSNLKFLYKKYKNLIKDVKNEHICS